MTNISIGRQTNRDLPVEPAALRALLTDEPTDLLEIWRVDLVAFAIGCSFSFEEALLEADCGSAITTRGGTKHLCPQAAGRHGLNPH